MLRRCVSIAGVLMLAVSISVPVPASKDRPLGVITQATAANLRTTPASPGTTIYDGDQLSTAAGGQLFVRSGSATIYLAAQSAATLHRVSLDSKSDQTQASLTSGTGIFSAAQSTSFEVSADHASIRPAKDQPTTAEVTILGPKELRVFARRGALEFSYGGESEVIEEGQAYRVILDPPDDSQSDGTQSSSKDQPIKKPNRRRKAFLFILIPLPLFLTWVGVHDALESPDRP